MGEKPKRKKYIYPYIYPMSSKYPSASYISKSSKIVFMFRIVRYVKKRRATGAHRKRNHFSFYEFEKGKKKRNLFSYRDITFEYEAIKEYQFWKLFAANASRLPFPSIYTIYLHICSYRRERNSTWPKSNIQFRTIYIVKVHYTGTPVPTILTYT